MQVGKKAGVVHLPCALQCDQCPSFSTVVINKSQYNIDTSVSELLKKKRSFFFFQDHCNGNFYPAEILGCESYDFLPIDSAVCVILLLLLLTV